MPRVRATRLLVKPQHWCVVNRGVHRLVEANRWLLGFGGYSGEFYSAGGSNNGRSTMNNNSQRPYSSLLSGILPDLVTQTVHQGRPNLMDFSVADAAASSISSEFSSNSNVSMMMNTRHALPILQ
ncbi:hypothetical protein KY284_008077 [Solanum tuberosum]|nr:hypothetical protein KY284_008077 [Solanum tuberosum]